MVYSCKNCNGEVVYHKGYNSGWGHVIATGCVKPSVNIGDWKRYLQAKKALKDANKGGERSENQGISVNASIGEKYRQSSTRG